jgi:molybdate transport system ATP-binding protein
MASEALAVRAALWRQKFRLEVAFDVHAGETLAIVGPSGAGKSSSISAVAGLLKPDSGRIALGDDVWCDTDRGIDRPPHQRRVGFVHQEFALFPHLTVLENVLYGARSRASARDAALRAAGSWIDQLGLAQLAGRPVQALSGGQRQRTALARALASGAGVLLLDEPFGSLDASTRNSVRRQLKEFLREVRLPTVIVTHDPTDALALADRIAILEDGRMSQIGPAEELLARPQSAFVAELFGMNFYRANLREGSGLREATVGTVVFHVAGLEAPGPVALAFPPSAVTLSLERASSSAQNVFEGIVREVAPLVDRMRVVCDCGIPIVADVVREASATLGLYPGRAVWASVKATAIRVYR